MTKILHIEGSPRKMHSHSSDVANTFLSNYQQHNPGTEITTLAIWNTQLPELDDAMLNAKYAVMRGENPSGAQASAWENVQNHFNYFNQADLYVLSVPMWNFGIPYRLKHYIDVITQPGMAWSYSPEESYQGLLQNKQAVVIYSSGDGYAEGTGFESFDLQKPYINLWLNFIGITDIKTITAEATLFAERSTENDAKKLASELALNLNNK